jgi:hypothetical protein
MNIEQKVMMLRELRKQHAYFLKNSKNNQGLMADELIVKVEEKIEQILKTI